MRSARAFPASAAVTLALVAAVVGAPRCVIAQSGAAVEDVISVDALLGAFATMPGLEATFVEEKHLGLLAAPLVSTGTLYFLPPGSLVRRTDTPRPSEVRVTSDRVEFTDDQGTEAIALDARPELRALVESMVWLLAGDTTSLRTAYHERFEPGPEGWRLTLTPRGEPLSLLIARMVVVGRGLHVHEVQVVETTGDETVTRITAANPARVFADDERARLFGTQTP